MSEHAALQHAIERTEHHLLELQARDEALERCRDARDEAVMNWTIAKAQLDGISDYLRFARGILENSLTFEDEGSYPRRAWTYIVTIQERLENLMARLASIPEAKPKPMTLLLTAFYDDMERDPYKADIVLRPGETYTVQIIDGIGVNVSRHPDSERFAITIAPTGR